MRDFAEYLLKQIVKDETALLVEESVTSEGILVCIHVAPEDMGLVIGKEGRTIRSIRNLLKAKAIKEGVRVNVELIEPQPQND